MEHETIKRARQLFEKVYALFKQGPHTADEIAFKLGETVLSVRPRVSELHKYGAIRKTGERRKNKSGVPANVWEMVPSELGA